MALIRIPGPTAEVAGTAYVLEFDSDAITVVETPREVVPNDCTGDCPSPCGAAHLGYSGRNSLILRFAALADAPKWVPV